MSPLRFNEFGLQGRAPAPRSQRHRGPVFGSLRSHLGREPGGEVRSSVKFARREPPSPVLPGDGDPSALAYEVSAGGHVIAGGRPSFFGNKRTPSTIWAARRQPSGLDFASGCRHCGCLGPPSPALVANRPGCVAPSWQTETGADGTQGFRRAAPRRASGARGRAFHFAEAGARASELSAAVGNGQSADATGSRTRNVDPWPGTR